MATLYISEYTALGRDAINDPVSAPKEPAVAVQAVTYTTSTASAAFNKDTRFVELMADATAHYAFGSAPTATTSYPYLAAGVPKFFAVDPGGKVAVYDGSS